ncbi:restriction endonuclease subunit S [Staphylococcus epidermidis]|nr:MULTISPECIES: restriction endonuclease subunit S [Staphylococcus]AVG08459.1 restriction endonuclease subunit S [Staphylococcus epidermidis]EKK3194157.1 restriction endonuclease subunit S [Staphylococcus aureus]EZI12037.1 type I restriction modification DNA specificity domain protein [Staphylococcus aureus subsp. aureus CO-30]KAB2251244.1 restriction endonuclease subunit S [Staphylococcus epidermidis]MBM5959557.1 restriction endonuclease subunit S [Staphylococcus epidermidis]
MTKQTNTPELRFPEFKNEWSKLTMNDFLMEDKQYGTQKDTNFPIVTSSRQGLYIQNKYFEGDRSFANKNVTFSIVPINYFTYRHMSDDDIFKFNINKFNTPILVSKEYPVFTVKNTFSQNFIFYELNNNIRFLKFCRIQKKGGTRTRLYFKNLLQYQTYFPNYEEQQKIGVFFYKLDQQIELEEKKLELLEQQKRGYMQKIFSQQLRFKDEKGNDYPKWIFKKFEEIFKVVPSKKYQIKSSEIEDNASIPVIDQGQNLILGFSNNKEKVFNDFKNVIIYGDHTTVIKRSDKPFIIGGDGVKLLTSKVDSDISYLYNALQYFNVKSEGYKRHFSILKNKDFYISTSIEEQKKIANIFNKLDKYIEKQFAKVELLKQRKQGLLQKMFV